MFEVGRLVARLAIEGIAAAGADLDTFGAKWKAAGAGAKAAGRDVDGSARSAETAGQRARSASTDVDKLGKSEQAAGAAASAAAGDIGNMAKAAEEASGTAAVLDEALSDVDGAAREAADGTDAATKSASRVGAAFSSARTEVLAIRDEFRGLSTDGRAAATEIGQGMLVAGAAVAAGAGLAIAKYAEFDASMSQVSAATGETTVNMNRLRQAALDAGADTKYSASEAAQGITELAKAGVQADDILRGGLAGALALAAAGEVSVADAAETAATALVQFRLDGSKVPHVADLIAAGAGKAQGGVGDLSAALKQGGLVASQFGLSVDSTVGTLAQFANAGLIGSDAGTSLKTMLLALANPSKESAALMEELGINAYNASGEFAGMESIAGQLTTAFEGKTDAERDSALATIFGSDAIRAASILYKDGAEGVRKWEASVNDAGYAARQAAELQNNLTGDLEKLGGAFDTALIQTGTAANDVLRGMVQTVTTLVDIYGALPAPIQGTGLALGIGTAGFLLLGGALLTGVSRVADFTTNMATLRREMPRTASAVSGITSNVGKLAVGLTLALGALSMWSQEQDKARGRAEQLATTLDQTTGAVTDTTTEVVAQNLALKNTSSVLGAFTVESESAYDAANKLGISLELVTDAASGNKPALEELNGIIKTGALGSEEFTEAYKASGLTLEEYTTATRELGVYVTEQNTAIEEGASAVKNKAEATKDGTAAEEGSVEATKSSTEAYLEQAETVGDLASQIHALIERFEELNGVGQDAVSANIDYQQSLSDIRDRIAETAAGADGYSKTLDLNTQAGRDNQAALLATATASQEAAYKQYDLDLATMGAKEATDLLRGRLEEGRGTLLANAQGLTDNAAEAQGFTDAVYRIPTSKEFDLLANTRNAQDEIDAFVARINRTTATIIVNTRPGATVSSAGTTGGLASAYADGAFKVSHHAAGSRTENHEAQFAAAGEMRVWAEPETGGETYIPHAESKRVRATQILAATAEDFGYQLVPIGAKHFANGASGAAGATGVVSREPIVAETGELIAWIIRTMDGRARLVLDEQQKREAAAMQRAGFEVRTW